MQRRLQLEEAPERGNIIKRRLQEEAPGGGTRKMLQEETSRGWGFLKRLCDKKADVPGEGSGKRISQEGEATGGWDPGEWLEYAQNGVGISRMKRRL